MRTGKNYPKYCKVGKKLCFRYKFHDDCVYHGVDKHGWTIDNNKYIPISNIDKCPWNEQRFK